MITFRCEDCDSRLTLEGKFAGASVKCPLCGWMNVVPEKKAQESKPRRRDAASGRKWGRTRGRGGVSAGRGPVAMLVAVFDRCVAGLAVACRKSDEAGIAPALKALAALGAAAMVVSALAITIAQGVQLFLQDGSSFPAAAAGWQWLLLRLTGACAAAAVGYIFAASSCMWLKEEIAELHDSTVFRALTVLALLSAVALVIVAVTTFISRNDLGAAAGMMLKACFVLLAGYVMWHPGLAGIRLVDAGPGSRKSGFVVALQLLEALTKVVLLLGVVGFIAGAAVVFVGWTGTSILLPVVGSKAAAFRRWGLETGPEAAGYGSAAVAAAYLLFLCVRLITGLFRSVKRIADGASIPTATAPERSDEAPLGDREDNSTPPLDD